MESHDDIKLSNNFLNFCSHSLITLASGQYDQLDLDAHNFNEAPQLRLIESLKQLKQRFKNLDHSLARFADGNYEVSSSEAYETDVISKRIIDVAKSHSELIKQIQLIIDGDFSQENFTRAENDELGESINKILANFKYINWRINMIAEGDCRAKIAPLSERDELGIALDNLTKSLREVANVAETVASGNLTQLVELKGKHDVLGTSINQMVEGLRSLDKENDYQQWYKSSINSLSDEMRGDQKIEVLLKAILNFFIKHLGFQLGCFYLYNEQEEILELKASHAFKKRRADVCKLSLGEGLVGQAALEDEAVIYNALPNDYLGISSSLGESSSQSILIAPVKLNGNLQGVFEFGSYKDIDESKLDFINDTLENIAISINSAQVHEQLEQLLNETETQRKELEKQTDALKQNQEELKSQQEELEQTNEELRVKSEHAEQANEELRVQSEELKNLNDKLEEKSRNLEEKQTELLKHNEELEKTQYELTEKAEQLSETSRYKTEFLANMSHELRTPLNSLMILAKMLADNTEGNLTEDQTESAGIILNSGKELMTLINEILDLSKVEAGKMEIHTDQVDLSDLMETLASQFRPMAVNKGLEFKYQVENDLPSSISTDSQRLKQILRNLISNAIKFTNRGSVSLYIRKKENSETDTNTTQIEFEIHDTGIGIPKDKLNTIFEAFQQVDGSTSREFGGTGLGLTICRELARLLGGDIFVTSEIDRGSQFRFTMPLVSSPETQPDETSNLYHLNREEEKKDILTFSTSNHPATAEYPPEQNQRSIKDDRESIKNNEQIILIIEDDKEFCKTLMNLARRKGYKCLTALDGQTGIELAKKWEPQGILLDLELPDIEGQKVLHYLKDNLSTRHIPVHIVSARDINKTDNLSGAIGHTLKPPTEKDILYVFEKIEKINKNKIKKLLLIEDDEVNRKAISSLIADSSLEIDSANDAKEAYTKLINNQYDCVVLDLTLPDSDGLELLKKIDSETNYAPPPIIVYTGKDISKKEHQELSQYAKAIVIKGSNAPERLLDEVAMFLHRVEDDLPDNQKSIVRNLHNPEKMLSGKHVLLVDDDMRNTFAMSKVLRANGLLVEIAENGQIAIDKLKSDIYVDIILMDIMMPIMDGYEAIKNIRKMEGRKDLPVIALTAKAMPEDRKKCLDAGANDYITKPVDTSILISMMQVWLTQKRNVSSLR